MHPPSPLNTYSYVREENLGSTRKFVQNHLLFTYIANQILALCTIHPRSIDGLEKLFKDSRKKVFPAHAQRVFTSTTSKYSDSPWCEPNNPLFRYVFFVVFGDKKVSWIPESYVRICGSWLVQASNSHVTTLIFSVTEYKKCTQTSKIIP